MAGTDGELGEGASDGSVVRVECVRCSGETRHLVLKSVQFSNGEEVPPERGGYSISWGSDHQIVRCQGCDELSFRVTNWFSEEEGQSEDLYPARVRGARLCQDFFKAPAAIRRIYREAIDCYNGDSLTLCAGGLRALVEGLCAAKGVVDGPVEIKLSNGETRVDRRKSLEARIAGLCEKGVITEDQAGGLHAHRYLGNDALHELNAPSKADLAMAFDMVEHIIGQVYEMPEMHAELLKRRAARKAKPAA